MSIYGSVFIFHNFLKKWNNLFWIFHRTLEGIILVLSIHKVVSEPVTLSTEAVVFYCFSDVPLFPENHVIALNYVFTRVNLRLYYSEVYLSDEIFCSISLSTGSHFEVLSSIFESSFSFNFVQIFFVLFSQSVY